MKQIALILAASMALAIMPSLALAAGGGNEIKNPGREPAQNGEGLNFMSYAEGIKKADQEGKLVMLFFWADWCRYCIQVRSEVFSLPRVREAFEQNYVAVSVDTENDKENIAAQYRPKALPTLAFIRPNGDTLGLLPGAVDADTFLEVIKYVTEEAGKKQ